MHKTYKKAQTLTPSHSRAGASASFWPFFSHLKKTDRMSEFLSELLAETLSKWNLILWALHSTQDGVGSCLNPLFTVCC